MALPRKCARPGAIAQPVSDGLSGLRAVLRTATRIHSRHPAAVFTARLAPGQGASCLVCVSSPVSTSAPPGIRHRADMHRRTRRSVPLTTPPPGLPGAESLHSAPRRATSRGGTLPSGDLERHPAPLYWRPAATPRGPQVLRVMLLLQVKDDRRVGRPTLRQRPTLDCVTLTSSKGKIMGLYKITYSRRPGGPLNGDEHQVSAEKVLVGDQFIQFLDAQGAQVWLARNELVVDIQRL